MNDETERKAAVKINWSLLLSTTVAVLGILFGYTQFLATAELEARKPFLQRQLDHCFEASRLAATLASTTDPEAFEEARERFKQLYWGGMVIIENRAVEQTMIDVFQGLNVGSDPELPVKSLQLESLCLAHSCRALLASSWDIDLEELSRVPTRCSES